MKIILIILMLLPFAKNYSQELKINLTAENEKLSVSLDENNSGRTFIIRKTNIAAKDYFNATVSDEVINKDWNRTFTIHNSGDSEIAKLKYIDNDTYCIALNELASKLQKGEQYYLYTIALPSDPKKAMLVKAARNLVCKIIIKN